MINESNTRFDNSSIKRQCVLETLRRNKLEMPNPYGLTRLALFGSAARDSTTNCNVLVAFDGPATSKGYFGVQFYLKDLLGCPVDLVTDKALRPELRPFIEREQINV